MTRLVSIALAVLLAGCGGSRRQETACAALATCCESGLPAEVGAGCDTVSSSSDESACAAELDAIHSASYCASVGTSDGPAASKASPCDRYLSCLLAVAPAAYAPALELYGADSACWSTSAQSAGCSQACDASFETIATQCICKGSSCSTCNAPKVGAAYFAVGEPTTTCPSGYGTAFQRAVLESLAPDRTAMILVEGVGTFTGVLSCNVASTLTLTPDSNNPCLDGATLTLTPATTPGTFVAQAVLSISSQCTYGAPVSCTTTVTVSS